MRKHYYLKNVVTLALDSHKCTGCGMCTFVCPHAVFEIRAKKAVMIDRDACMECGACARNCPTGAITVNAGVGCAAAIIEGAIAGTEPTCGGCEKPAEAKSTCC
jgi:NAD-dependent dihydropyrimidine dehydrogenase PreA subunit